MKILVTCGATREPIDPVRFISNYSTGYLGCEIAREAKKRGHRVILISGPIISARPKQVGIIDVQTGRQMEQRLKAKFNWCDCLIMAAAVCDFRPQKVARKKIKRSRRERLNLTLIQNPDILKNIGLRKNGKMLVGFALETENLEENAWDKLRQKNLDLIVAIRLKKDSCPFGQVKMDSLMIDKEGHKQRIIQTTKRRLARILLDKIERWRRTQVERERSAKPLFSGSNPLAAYK